MGRKTKPITKKHIKVYQDTFEILYGLRPLLYRVHDYAFYPTLPPSNEGIRGSGSLSRSPGIGDAPAVAAYRMAAQDLARAHMELFKAALATDRSFPYWRLAGELLPSIITTPSPSQLFIGSRMTAEGLKAFADSGYPLAELNARGTLTGGLCYFVERAQNTLSLKSNKPTIHDTVTQIKEQYA